MKTRPARAAGALLLGALALAACGGKTGGLSDEAFRYCTTQAQPDELAAAAKALNLQVDPQAFASGRQDRGDPVFAQACEYAYQAHGRDLDVPAGQPNAPALPGGGSSPTAPLNPQASPGVEVTPAPSASA